MKNYFILSLLSVLILASCSENSSSSEAHIYGNIKGAASINLYVKAKNINDTIVTDENGNFDHRFTIDKPSQVSLYVGSKGYIPTFLSGGYDLKISTVFTSVFDSLKFEGKGALEAETIVNDYKLQNQQKPYPSLFKVSPVELMPTYKEFVNQRLALLNKDNLDQNFVIYYTSYINYSYLYYLHNYESAHENLSGEKSTLDAEAVGLLNKYFIEDANLLDLPSYIYFMADQSESKFKIENSIDNLQGNQVRFIEWLSKNIKLESLREQLVSDYANREIQNNPGDEIMDAIYNSANTIILNGELKASLESRYKSFTNLRPGAEALNWSYPDKDGNMHSLSDYRGKLVYIDLWATWCGPCKSEIPYLAKIVEEYKDKGIVFISISIDEDKDKWLKMVNEENYQWEQLLANQGFKSEIITYHKIRGIPRFIMVDQEGKLIDQFAPIPSSEKIRPYIDQHLK